MKSFIWFVLVLAFPYLGSAQELQGSFSHLEQFYIKNGVALHGEKARLARLEDQRRIIALMRTDLRGDPMDLPQGDAPYSGQQFRSSPRGNAFVQPESERPQGNDKGYPQGNKGYSPPPPAPQPLIASTTTTTTTTTTKMTTTKAPCPPLLTEPPTPPPCPTRTTTPAPYDPPCPRSEYNRNFRSSNSQIAGQIPLYETVNAWEDYNQEAMMINDQPTTSTARTMRMGPARSMQDVHQQSKPVEVNRAASGGEKPWLQERSSKSSPPRSVPTLLLYNTFFTDDTFSQNSEKNANERTAMNQQQRRGRNGRRWRNRHSRRQ